MQIRSLIFSSWTKKLYMMLSSEWKQLIQKNWKYLCFKGFFGPHLIVPAAYWGQKILRGWPLTDVPCTVITLPPWSVRSAFNVFILYTSWGWTGPHSGFIFLLIILQTFSSTTLRYFQESWSVRWSIWRQCGPAGWRIEWRMVRRHNCA